MLGVLWVLAFWDGFEKNAGTHNNSDDAMFEIADDGPEPVVVRTAAGKSKVFRRRHLVALHDLFTQVLVLPGLAANLREFSSQLVAAVGLWDTTHSRDVPFASLPDTPLSSPYELPLLD